jgi:putative chitinase
MSSWGEDEMRFFDIADTGAVDFSKLTRQLPNRPTWNPLSTQGQYISAILQCYPMFRENGITTPQRLAHFLGQGIVETNYLQAKGENLNYSFDGLKRTFGHKFASDDEIRQYARNPEKIANRVYANRLGNGPEESGDGWRYRGRGFFQLTGKDNYRRYGELAGVDLVGDPDVLSRDLKASLQVAAAYFNRTGLGEFADANNIAAVSRGVNRGDPRSPTPAIGEAERIQWTTKALELVNSPQAILQDAALNAPVADGALALGSTGVTVGELQDDLHALTYTTGSESGVFGPETRRAVMNFQEEHSLPVTGIVDEATKVAIHAARQDAPARPPNPPSTLPPGTPPLSQSRTIWGAILAGLAALVEFVRATVTQFANLFPVVSTPYGRFNTIFILAAFLLLGLVIVIYARIDDRRKKRR